MHVAEIWRYPVKSMAGERIREAAVTSSGIVGDRVVQVADAGGRLVTARTHPRLLGLHAVMGPDGEPLVQRRPWRAAETAAAVRAAAGADARLIRDEGPGRFDVLPLLIGTDGAFARLAVDHRRLRPNIVIGDVDGLAERAWPGHRLRIGEVLVSVAKLRARCVMTTFHPDTQEQDLSVLRRIVAEFGGRMALDCAVVRGGRIAEGDPVELVAREG